MDDLKSDMSEKDAAESFVARQIVHEIMNYGVTQFQVAKVIELLAFELENRELMVKIVDAVKEKTTANDTNGIILDGQEV